MFSESPMKTIPLRPLYDSFSFDFIGEMSKFFQLLELE